MATLRNLLHRITVVLVLVEVLISYCNASCDVSDFTAVINGDQAESEVWLATVGKSGKRPLHMNYYQTYLGQRFTGIAIPGNNNTWHIDIPRQYVTYKGLYCHKWKSAYWDNGTHTWIQCMDACRTPYVEAQGYTAVQFGNRASELQQKGYVLKSLTAVSGTQKLVRNMQWCNIFNAACVV